MSTRDEYPTTDINQVATTTPTGEDTMGMLAEPNAVMVMDQRPGSEVVASQVYLNPEGLGGYVVIHESVNGEPGAVLGTSAYLPAGESTGVTVTLTRATKDGETLVAVLHNDDGDKTYNAQLDGEVTSTIADGEAIMGQFMIDVDAPTDIQVMF